MSVSACARRIIEVVAKSGLRPVQASQVPEPITVNYLGVVCYQVVLPFATLSFGTPSPRSRISHS